MGGTGPNYAPHVCDPCRRRKKACDRAIPVCSRCEKFKVKCYYVNTKTETATPVVAPTDVPLLPGRTPQSQGVEYQVLIEARKLLNDILERHGHLTEVWDAYFRNLHRSLPIINQEQLQRQFTNNDETSQAHFPLVLLSIYLLITRLLPHNPEKGDDQLYVQLKSIHSLLQSTGNVSTDLIQAGLMIAVYEHSQAMHRDAWLTVGTCARMGHLLGLHTLIKQVSPPEGSQRAGFEEKRRLWWIIVVLERIVSHDSKDTRLPFASEPPHAHDILPPRSLEVETPPIVISDMLLPEHINLEDRGAIPSRQFTGLGPFPTTIQAVYLSTLIDEHIKTTFSNPELRKLNARKLHACLESFSGACIPGPGKSEGTYCGSYSIRTFAVFALYEHELALAVQEGDLDSISQITTSSLALANLVIYLTGSTEDKPIDMPTLSYWSHRITYLACMTFIKYAPRDGDWEGKIEVCRRYLGQLTPRFRIYSDALLDIDEARKNALRSSESTSMMIDT